MTRASQALHLLALLAIGLSSCKSSESSASTAADAPAGSVAHGHLLPPPSGPLELSAASASKLTLDVLVKRLSVLTGVTYSMAPNVQERMRGAAVALTQEQRIPAAEVYPWVESLLQQQGYKLAILKDAGTHLVGVYLASDRPSEPSTTLLEAEQLGECRMHPATQFMILLTLPNTEVRSLGNSLRILSPDSPSGSVIPVGTTNGVILSGSGRTVADLADLLLRTDAESKKKEQAQTEAAAQKP